MTSQASAWLPTATVAGLVTLSCSAVGYVLAYVKLLLFT